MHRGESKLLLVHCIASPTYMYQPKKKFKKKRGGGNSSSCFLKLAGSLFCRWALKSMIEYGGISKNVILQAGYTFISSQYFW